MLLCHCVWVSSILICMFWLLIYCGPLRDWLTTGPQWCLTSWGVQGLFDQSGLRRRNRQTGTSTAKKRVMMAAVCVCLRRATHSFHHSLTPSLTCCAAAWKDALCRSAKDFAFILFLMFLTASSLFYPSFLLLVLAIISLLLLLVFSTNSLWFLYQTPSPPQILCFPHASFLFLFSSFPLRTVEAHGDNGHGRFPRTAHFHWEQPGTATSFLNLCFSWSPAFACC